MNDKTKLEANKPCCSGNSACTSQLGRREFLQIGASATTATAVSLPVMAGPFEANEYLQAIPIDKKLDERWVASLYARGKKETYSSLEALRNIGMPVGGLFAGTVYLGGDGQLWLWDIFNRDQEGILPRPMKKPVPNASPEAKLVHNMTRGGQNYLEPAEPASPFEQFFFVRIGDDTRRLNGDDFAKVNFDGRYPIGRVRYEDPECPVKISLEAFSPFSPLNVDDSSLPATVMSFSVKNTQDKSVSLYVAGSLQNPVCLDTAKTTSGLLKNKTIEGDTFRGTLCSAEQAKDSVIEVSRDDILIADFESPNYGDWTKEGTAFGTGPIAKSEIPSYQGNVTGDGKRVVNSHATAPGESIPAKDGATGTLTSKPFSINRRFLQFFVGGGSHKNKTCVNLLVNGKVVASRSGENNNRMTKVEIDTSKFEGREGTIQIVDEVSGPWGNIGADHFVLTDRRLPAKPIASAHDFGTMALIMLGKTEADHFAASEKQNKEATTSLDDRLVGQVGRNLNLTPGEEATVTFVVTWHFPNLTVRDMPQQVVGHSYAARFSSAHDVASYVAKHFDRLAGKTRKWVETWYDSTLPFWLLDRTMANTSILATTTCYRFKDGRFWAWEGVGCCPGTCTHVWHYAQAVGRLFPEIERDQRERVDFGLALSQEGIVGHRSYLSGNAGPAIDGQCGRILGVYREHQMSSDSDFLERVWPKVKKALMWLIQNDENVDGLLEGKQENTLDAAWYGKISWISSLYIAALRAGQYMAEELNDETFAAKCRRIADSGSEAMMELFNGEYFLQKEDPRHADKISSGVGCHIDQVFGQTWAHWVGMDHLFDRQAQLTALRSLWKYNFVPDVGAFRKQFKRGRWYASTGDAGLIMCSWPKGGQKANSKNHWQYGYFNECMSGFEWQVAAHMIFEGHDHPDLLKYGLAISRAVHDRYNGNFRNPYNEIECSDHYSRAMASYGVFQAICGYRHDGPKGHLAFAPRLSPDSFRSAFTAANSWGTFEQERKLDGALATITIHDGVLELSSLELDVDHNVSDVRIALGSDNVPKFRFKIDGSRLNILFSNRLKVESNASLNVDISFMT